MRSRLCFEYLMALGNGTSSLLLDRDLDEYEDRPAMENAGLLKPVDLNGRTVCPDCGTMLPYTITHDADGKRIPLASCPNCGVFSPSSMDFRAWSVDYTPIISAAAKYLNCSGQIAEILPEVLWNLGRAPVAGQSREIFVARSLCAQHVAENISRMLPENRTAVLLVIGNIPPLPFSGFDAGRIFPIKDFCVPTEDGFIFDSASVIAKMRTVIENRPQKAKAPGRHSKMGDLLIKLKAELRQYMIGVYGAIEQAESAGRDYDFQQIKQVELARMTDVDKYTITRALQTDLELKALFDAARNRASVCAYGRKAIR